MVIRGDFPGIPVQGNRIITCRGLYHHFQAENIMRNRPFLVLRLAGVFLAVAGASLGVLNSPSSHAGQTLSPSIYVGTDACKPCHEKEYSSYVQYAKKSQSYQSIVRLEKGLSVEDLKKCYGCHTTGYGRPGGFTSIEETPDLKNAGCEVCHGPGGTHVKTADSRAIIKRPTREDCENCHTAERIKAFRYRPLIHGGGH